MTLFKALIVHMAYFPFITSETMITECLCNRKRNFIDDVFVLYCIFMCYIQQAEKYLQVKLVDKGCGVEDRFQVIFARYRRGKRD